MATIQRDGRTWSIDSNGINNLKRRYVIELSTNNLGANGEFANLEAYGIPAVGTAHPSYDYLKVQSYDVEEGEEAEKKLIKVTVNYGLDSSQTEPGQTGDEEVEEWGWQAGVTSRDVVTNLFTDQFASRNGQVLNSAGDPFDSVPTADYPSPVFQKVLKTKSRKDWLGLNCKINKNDVTIGSMKCAQKTLLASISEQRIFGDATWKYRYTISLQYRSNMSNFGAGTKPIEFGWDIGIVDSGMRQLDKDRKPQVIMQIDQESKMPTAITQPELLDGSGHAVKRVAGEAGAPQQVKPYIIRVQAYETETFPAEIYSEPA